MALHTFCYVRQSSQFAKNKISGQFFFVWIYLQLDGELQNLCFIALQIRLFYTAIHTIGYCLI